MEGKKLFNYEEDQMSPKKEISDDNSGNTLLKILQIILGIIMGAFHI